jgi:hypothetical protein
MIEFLRSTCIFYRPWTYLLFGEVILNWGKLEGFRLFDTANFRNSETVCKVCVRVASPLGIFNHNDMCILHMLRYTLHSLDQSPYHQLLGT